MRADEPVKRLPTSLVSGETHIGAPARRSPRGRGESEPADGFGVKVGQSEPWYEAGGSSEGQT